MDMFNSDLQLEIVVCYIKTGLRPLRSCDRSLAFSLVEIFR